MAWCCRRCSRDAPAAFPRVLPTGEELEEASARRWAMEAAARRSALERGAKGAPPGCLERVREDFKYPLCHGCAPALPLEELCAAVLLSTARGAVRRGALEQTWEVDETERQTMRDDMFSFVDRDNSDHISVEELSNFCSKRAEHILKHWHPIFHGILKDDIRQFALDEFDRDGNEGLSKAEFEHFSDHLEKQYLKYLQRREFLKFRAFWGLGHGLRAATARGGYARVEQDEGRVAPDAGRWGVVLGFDPDIPAARKWTGTIIAPGWWEDLRYYSANNHPLHGIFMCDPAHPLDWRERIMMEVVVFCLTYASLYAHKRCMHTRYGLDETTFDLLCVTLPGMVLWYVLFYMYTCPCANVDEAHSTKEATERSKCLRICSEDIAHTIVLLGLVCLLWRAHANDASAHEVRDVVLPVCMARARGYGISWFLMLFVYFNPLVAWGSPRALEKEEKGALDKLADLVGLGQWRVEKMRFWSLRGAADPESAVGRGAAGGDGRRRSLRGAAGGNRA